MRGPCVRVLRKEGALTLPFPPSDLDPNRVPLFLPSNLLAPSVISFVAKQAFPRPGNSRLSLTLVSQTRTASRPTRFRPSSKMVCCFPPESTQTQYELNSTVLCPCGTCTGLIIPQRTQGLQTSVKGSTHVSTLSPVLDPQKLIHDSSPCLGCRRPRQYRKRVLRPCSTIGSPLPTDFASELA